MADELNVPTHRWYEPRNNIALSPRDYSKQWIYDSGIQKIDAWISSQPWGVSIETLNTWFLRTGTWSSSGAWVDQIAFPVRWFLSSGTFNNSGIWSDSEAWT